jgi:O-antigen/teichoic acid export membrane protein
VSATNRSSRLIGWIGWAGLDAIGRLALMTGSTIILSRLLAPRDFGMSALVLTLVASAAIFVGSPFEDALAQRRNLRMAHLRAALGASWLVGGILMVLSLLAGNRLAQLYGEADVQLMLPVAMLSIFFSGHSDILTALARRLRRFNDVAYATLIGHVIGIGLSLVIAVLGYGAWALVAQRLLVVVARAVILQQRIGFVVLPGWSLHHLRDLSRFASISFLSRLTENLTYLAFNNLVQAFYGVAVLGHVNMAMRLIEPIRGAIAATGHNLAFSFFARAGRGSGALAQTATAVVAQSALVTAPVFVGMAAIMPRLLPLVAGPGWEEAIPLAMTLAMAGALAVPAGLIYTAFSAGGRPEFSLLSLLVGFVALVVVLLTFRSLGPISVGLSRLAGDLVRAVFAIVLPSGALVWGRGTRLASLGPAWLLAGAMGGVVTAVHLALPGINAALALIGLIAVGIVAYAGLVLVFARRQAANLMARVNLPGAAWLNRSAS